MGSLQKQASRHFTFVMEIETYRDISDTQCHIGYVLVLSDVASVLGVVLANSLTVRVA